ncbi:hypothetical protein LX81_02618 [Palleronia aestuarii]|uniref:Uncharacterized protein n=1 Tax=Palleronia aestuarii TaxID=568105 RepID=A0A2W7N4M6_9RHOB|nr:hypothetical protein [Palleronia aestuarii]PZX15030.1 hypothetical protein LX81_02618 [Palleronia aestuarii]
MEHDDSENGEGMQGDERYRDIVSELFTITNILLTMPPDIRSKSLRRRHAELLAQLAARPRGGDNDEE